MELDLVTYAVPFLLVGAKTTLLISVFGVALGLPFGIALAVIRTSRNRILRRSANIYCAIFRGTPMLVQIFVIYYGLVLAVVLNTGAYTAEIFRTALLSLPRGLIEASQACGLSVWATFRHVKFPLAVRQALPAYSSEVAIIVKESSLASTITVLEITGYAKRLMSETFAIMDIFIITSAFFLMMNVISLTSLKLIERKLSFGK
jgi:octopine/nopaline transport system permease protein